MGWGALRKALILALCNGWKANPCDDIPRISLDAIGTEVELLLVLLRLNKFFKSIQKR